MGTQSLSRGECNCAGVGVRDPEQSEEGGPGERPASPVGSPPGKGGLQPDACCQARVGGRWLREAGEDLHTPVGDRVHPCREGRQQCWETEHEAG